LYKKFGRRKGVSPVIAVLLLIAIAVATGILVYVWVSGLAGSLSSSSVNQVTEQLTLTSYKFDSNSLYLYIKNTGGNKVTIDQVYVNGVGFGDFTVTTNLGATSGTSTSLYSIGVGEVVKIIIDTSNADTTEEGKAYIIKVTTSTGGVFTWTVVKGRSG
jgi:flagellin-like protein